MRPEPVIVHRVRGRVRLRVVGDIEDPEYFTELAAKLQALPGVEGTKINERTRSIVLTHPDAPFSDLEPGLKAIGLQSDAVQRPVTSRAISPVDQGFSRINQAIAAATAGSLDLRTLGFVVFAVLAIRQVLRGNIMAPAISLVWYAMELALRAVNGNDNGSDGGDA